jgi:hypothetical protein
VQFRFDTMLLVPDGGLGDTDNFGDFSLEEAKIHSFFADVVANGDRINGITGKYSFFNGKMD